jgi:hypothetical protein
MGVTIYAGKGKEGKYGLKLSLCLDDMYAYAKDNIEPAKNGKKYIRLDVVKMKEEDQNGNTYTAKIDTWKKEA